MLKVDDVVTGVDYDDDLEVVVVRTETETDFEEKLQKKDPHLRLRRGHRLRRHDGGAGKGSPCLKRRCAPVGSTRSPDRSTPCRASIWKRGQSTAQCSAGATRRSSIWKMSVDTTLSTRIAGWMLMHGESAGDKLLYTTGRLTSEMVIKTAMMGIPRARLAFRLHRLGRRDCPTGRADSDRAHARPALRLPLRRGAA